MMNKILIVNDDIEQRTNLRTFLRAKGHYTVEVSSGREAIDMAVKEKIDIVLLEIMISTLNSKEIIVQLRKFKPKTRVIIISGSASINDVIETMKLGASDYISRPFIEEELDTVIRRCLEEAKFDASDKNLDLDFTICSLSNPIRRNIIKLLCQKNGINLMEITRILKLKKHTNTLFHLKILQDSSLIKHDTRKDYFLTKEGVKTFGCLKMLENNFYLIRKKRNGRKTKLLGI